MDRWISDRISNIALVSIRLRSMQRLSSRVDSSDVTFPEGSRGRFGSESARISIVLGTSSIPVGARFSDTTVPVSRTTLSRYN